MHPDGTAYNIADGIVRARMSGGSAQAVPAEPEQPRAYAMDLVATSQLLRAGHRIRVDVASSNFPRFDRNPGTGQHSAEVTAAELTPQRQTVFHDADRPSHILLPIIPG